MEHTVPEGRVYNDGDSVVASRRHGGRNRKPEQKVHILNFKHEAERENREWCGVFKLSKSALVTYFLPQGLTS